MTRKSKDQRILETRQLLKAWEAVDLTNDKRYLFIYEMLSSLERGKNLTAKQKEWLDSLIKQGAPQPTANNEQIVQKIESAIKVFESAKNRDWQIGVLRDLRARIITYGDISEKQRAVLDSLLLESEKLNVGKCWKPDAEMIKDLKSALMLYKGYDLGWRAVRPGLAIAYREIFDYLRGENQFLQERSALRLLESVDARLQKLKSPKFKIGDFVNHRGDIIYCISEAYVDDGGIIVNDWLTASNSAIPIDQEKIKKTKKKF